MRTPNIKPVEHLHDESTSIEAALTENLGDVKEDGVLADELEATKLFL